MVRMRGRSHYRSNSPAAAEGPVPDRGALVGMSSVGALSSGSTGATPTTSFPPTPPDSGGSDGYPRAPKLARGPGGTARKTLVQTTSRSSRVNPAAVRSSSWTSSASSSSPAMETADSRFPLVTPVAVNGLPSRGCSPTGDPRPHSKRSFMAKLNLSTNCAGSVANGMYATPSSHGVATLGGELDSRPVVKKPRLSDPTHATPDHVGVRKPAPKAILTTAQITAGNTTSSETPVSGSAVSSLAALGVPHGAQGGAAAWKASSRFHQVRGRSGSTLEHSSETPLIRGRSASTFEPSLATPQVPERARTLKDSSATPLLSGRSGSTLEPSSATPRCPKRVTEKHSSAMSTVPGSVASTKKTSASFQVPGRSRSTPETPLATPKVMKASSSAPQIPGLATPKVPERFFSIVKTSSATVASHAAHSQRALTATATGPGCAAATLKCMSSFSGRPQSLGNATFGQSNIFATPEHIRRAAATVGNSPAMPAPADTSRAPSTLETTLVTPLVPGHATAIRRKSSASHSAHGSAPASQQAVAATRSDLGSDAATLKASSPTPPVSGPVSATLNDPSATPTVPERAASTPKASASTLSCPVSAVATLKHASVAPQGPERSSLAATTPSVTTSSALRSDVARKNNSSATLPRMKRAPSTLKASSATDSAPGSASAVKNPSAMPPRIKRAASTLKSSSTADSPPGSAASATDSPPGSDVAPPMTTTAADSAPGSASASKNTSAKPPRIKRAVSNVKTSSSGDSAPGSAVATLMTSSETNSSPGSASAAKNPSAKPPRIKRAVSTLKTSSAADSAPGSAVATLMTSSATDSSPGSAVAPLNLRSATDSAPGSASANHSISSVALNTRAPAACATIAAPRSAASDLSNPAVTLPRTTRSASAIASATGSAPGSTNESDQKTSSAASSAPGSAQVNNSSATQSRSKRTASALKTSSAIDSAPGSGVAHPTTSSASVSAPERAVAPLMTSSGSDSAPGKAAAPVKTSFATHSAPGSALPGPSQRPGSSRAKDTPPAPRRTANNPKGPSAGTSWVTLRSSTATSVAGVALASLVARKDLDVVALTPTPDIRPVLKEQVQRSFKCLMCPKKSPTLVLHVQHMRSQHMNPQPYLCMLCERRFPYANELVQHADQCDEDIQGATPRMPVLQAVTSPPKLCRARRRRHQPEAEARETRSQAMLRLPTLDRELHFVKKEVPNKSSPAHQLDLGMDGAAPPLLELSILYGQTPSMNQEPVKPPAVLQAVCPLCGRSFRTPADVKRHHARVHRPPGAPPLPRPRRRHRGAKSVAARRALKKNLHFARREKGTAMQLSPAQHRIQSDQMENQETEPVKPPAVLQAVCPLCGRSFRTPADVKRHHARVHRPPGAPPLPRPRRRPRGAKSLHLTRRDKGTPMQLSTSQQKIQPDQMEIQMNEEIDAMPALMPVVQTQRLHSTGRKTPLQKLSKLTPYACNKCNKRFSALDKFRYHCMYHSQEQGLAVDQ